MDSRILYRLASVVLLASTACGSDAKVDVEAGATRTDLPASDATWTMDAAVAYVASLEPNADVKIVLRDDWTHRRALPGDYDYVPIPVDDSAYDSMTSLDTIVVHHAALTQSLVEGAALNFDGRTDVMVNIYDSHVSQGLADIGYHYMIHPTGAVWEARPLVRLDKIDGATAYNMGAHVEGFNEGSIGIVLVGNFEPRSDGLNPNGYLDGTEEEYLRQPTPAQAAALVDLVATLQRRYPTIQNLYSHGQGDGLARNPGASFCPGEGSLRMISAVRARFAPATP